MTERKIVIELSDANNPPRVFVDGEETKVISIDYQYKTKTDVDSGKHELNLLMPSIINGHFQTKGFAFELNNTEK